MQEYVLPVHCTNLIRLLQRVYMTHVCECLEQLMCTLPSWKVPRMCNSMLALQSVAVRQQGFCADPPEPPAWTHSGVGHLRLPHSVRRREQHLPVSRRRARTVPQHRILVQPPVHRRHPPS